jgi:hypothetical protein
MQARSTRLVDRPRAQHSQVARRNDGAFGKLLAEYAEFQHRRSARLKAIFVPVERKLELFLTLLSAAA